MERERFSEKASARILGVHFDTLRRWRNQRRIRYFRSATGRISYSLDDLQAFAMATAVEPAAPPALDNPSDQRQPAEVVYPFGHPAGRR